MVETMEYSVQDQVLADELQELALLRDEMNASARQLETEVLVMMCDRLLVDQANPRSSAFRTDAPRAMPSRSTRMIV